MFVSDPFKFIPKIGYKVGHFCLLEPLQNSIPECRGVASFTQIRTCVLEKLVGFFKDFLRTPSSIPF